MSFKREIGKIVETGRGNGEIFSLEWSIPNFPSLAGERGDLFGSPAFRAFNEWWLLRICPYGLWQDFRGDCVSLYLYRWDGGLPQTLDVTLGIRGLEGVENKRERRQEFSNVDCACFLYDFCSRSKLTEQNSRLMKGNRLIISLVMKSIVPKVGRDSSTQTVEEAKEDEVPTEENQSADKQGIEKLSEDVGKLLVSGDGSDVTVQVGEMEFKAHRLILSARCPVLAAMFKHETEERATNRITISDCDPEVFVDFLHYLYKGSAQHLSEENVFGLYRVADKYLAADLKQQCLQHIQDTLSVHTFCDVVQLALTHGQSGLLEQATDFASKNIRSIIRTVEWQNFNRDHPTEANEILIRALGPPS